MISKIQTKLNSFELFTIFKDDNHSFILDSAIDKEKLGRYSIISANPFDIIKIKNSNQDPLKELRKKLSKYKIDNKTHIPFIGGAVGYLSYDLCHYIENLPKTALDDVCIPDIYMGLYNWAIVVDHLKEEVYIATPDIDKDLEKKIIDEVTKRVLDAENNIDKICYEESLHDKIKLKSNFKKEDYIKAINKIKNYIETGDVYQVNLTQRFEGEINVSDYEIYRDLRRISPAPFGALLRFDDAKILSNSPERFIKCVDKIIQTRPIKGTRPRGRTKKEDQMYKNELINSEKDKAELLMIVDLERNDLGKVCQIGSVKVPELFKLEEYSNVHHLVSTVIGKLKDECDAVDIIKATFPGGSITGAPKIRAMEIIDELEPNKRNVYTGSIGYIGFDGNLDFNIAIRTIVKKGEKIYFQVGGGITWDSNPNEEYEETLHKAKSIIKALKGVYEE
ncbi:para-aminobenzoate synthetase component 1 [Alkalithermobacter thermoalcaliphilus JW-YL-7 = DSM 7308]|uniref:aminodeoxychorismate synthase n=1 Tax=Alkalithermobacter thermoalcaliphilus JW-YL-7 = DSM 7308 TaxID=1121328 RepID=A0A150FQ51_CLOPD|nr:para-aminobenzoate synthase, subunit I [[Clostridium] paradoxum JW-YL-7 = DSM 7308]SHK62929.1 para-aminobenzoate synthetase component 1 [[Clostridium] paradoxum JW-YL-7 = DSM 7308]